MKNQVLECVPNISEGRDLSKINEIVKTVTAVEGIKLLHTDVGRAANRTVITFVGKPEKVVEAAFRLIKKACELIDMRKHFGKHPRFGAVDVCPLIPIANITLEQTVRYAHKLGEKVGNQLGISGYFYEDSATHPDRKKLENLRFGQYEGLREKLKNPNWKPDFGPTNYNNNIARSGLTAIGARNFLIAYNVNLNTADVQKAKQIASQVRESGKTKKLNGNITRIPGRLEAVKAIGWYIEEYAIAQVSYNITDIDKTPIAKVFEATLEFASIEGVEVTGSEIIGLVPLKALLETADYFLSKQGDSLNIPEREKIKVAEQNLGLSDTKPFYPNEKIIEYCIKN